jgi:2-keto-4-pentenoate hydratase/2-oxohepta-3-ene-1,7-dioic acid hydratase in catechol pathway
MLNVNKKYLRYFFEDKSCYGLVEGELIHQIKSNFLFNKPIKTGNVIRLDDVKILPPVIPSKVVGLAYNYKDLVGEKESYSEPLIFLKSSTSVVGMHDDVIIPDDLPAWGEVELAIIIGKEAKNIPLDKANSFIFGYTVANDITMKNIEFRDHHLARSKSCDTFCPLGPWVVTNIDTSKLSLVNEIDGKKFQEGNTSNRIVNDVEAVSLVSKYMTLYPGDVIITGTPKNAMNSLIFSGSTISVTVQNIGTLTNKIQKK